MPRLAQWRLISLLGRVLEHMSTDRSAAGVHPARPREGDLLTFNQLAE